MERKLGGQERAALARHLEGYYASILVGAEYSVTMTKEILYPALAAVVAENSMLSVNAFLTGPGTYAFRKLAAVDLEKVVVYEPDETRNSFTHKVASTLYLPYNVDLPLWRVYVLDHGKSVMVAMDHCNFDGVCGPLFHQKLLAKLNSDVAALSGFAATSCSSPIPLPLDQVVDLRPTLFESVYEKVSSWLGFVPKATMTEQNGLQFVTDESNDSSISFLDLTSSQTLNLLSVCRQHGITMLSLISAVYTIADMQVFLLPDFKDKPVEYTLLHSIGGRRFLGPAYEETLGNNYLAFPHTSTVVLGKCGDPDYIIQLAKETGQTLKRCVSPEDRTLKVLWSKQSLKTVGQHCETLRSRLGCLAPHAAESSNLRMVKVSHIAQDRVKMQSIWFTGPIVSTSYRALFHIVSLEDGPCTISLSEAKDSDKVKGPEVLCRMKKILSVFCD